MRKLPLPGALISAAFIGVAVLVSVSGPGRAFEVPNAKSVAVGEPDAVIDSPAIRAARAGCHIVAPNFEAPASSHDFAPSAAGYAANLLDYLVGMSCVNRSADAQV